MFKIKLLKQVEYFDTEDTTNNIIFFDEIQFHMNKKVYEKGDFLASENQKCDKMIFIVEGKIEIE